MLGFQLITQLNTLIKTSKFTGRTNAALDKAVGDHDRPDPNAGPRSANYLTIAKRFPVPRRKSPGRSTPNRWPVIGSIIDSLNKWRIGGLTFASAVTSKDLREFAYLFVSLDPATKSVDDFRQELTAREVNGIDLKIPANSRSKKIKVPDPTSGKASDAPTDPKVQHKIQSKNALCQRAGEQETRKEKLSGGRPWRWKRSVLQRE